jgi:hypothetical protein
MMMDSQSLPKQKLDRQVLPRLKPKPQLNQIRRLQANLFQPRLQAEMMLLDLPNLQRKL